MHDPHAGNSKPNASMQTEATDSAVLAQYRATLNEWARQHVPTGARITSVDIRYDDGYDPTYGSHEASLDVSIHYERPDHTSTWPSQHSGVNESTAHVLSSMGDLLTALFAIENGPTGSAGPQA